jgi:hypothetical protein
MTGVYTMRNGRIVQQEFVRDHQEALKAAGLREEDLKPAE